MRGRLREMQRAAVNRLNAVDRRASAFGRCVELSRRWSVPDNLIGDPHSGNIFILFEQPRLHGISDEQVIWR